MTAWPCTHAPVLVRCLLTLVAGLALSISAWGDDAHAQSDGSPEPSRGQPPTADVPAPPGSFWAGTDRNDATIQFSVLHDGRRVGFGSGYRFTRRHCRARRGYRWTGYESQALAMSGRDGGNLRVRGTRLSGSGGQTIVGHPMTGQATLPVWWTWVHSDSVSARLSGTHIRGTHRPRVRIYEGRGRRKRWIVTCTSRPVRFVAEWDNTSETVE